MSDRTSYARHHGLTNEYSIYPVNGGPLLIEGKAEFPEFQRLLEAIRRAETLAAAHAVGDLLNRLDRFSESERHGS